MKEKNDSILALRGFGCIIIVAYHVYVIRGFQGLGFVMDHTVGIGGVIVPLFFIISAYSCMCGYFDRILSAQGVLEIFYIRRIKRLMPTFYLALILHSIINAFFLSAVNIPAIVGTASFLYGLMPQFRESVVDAGWALGIEIIFYLSFPCFIIFCKSKKRTWLTMFGTLLLLWAYETYYAVGVSDSNNKSINFIEQLIFFVTGALLFHYKHSIRALKPKAKAALLFSCVLCAGALYFGFDYSSAVINSVIIAIMFSGLMMISIADSGFYFAKRLFGFLGNISYQVYLFHMIIFKLLSYTNILDSIHTRLVFHPYADYFTEYFLILIPTIIFAFLWRKTEESCFFGKAQR